MSEYDCASCESHDCRQGIDCFGISERIRQLYAAADPLNVKLLQTASKIEVDGYMRWPRAYEIIQFSKDAGFSHLGIAFCIGLAEEARIYADLLKQHFEVSSVCCKVCGIDKNEFGLPRLHPEKDEEAMCSPLGQAELLNRARTEFNVLIGLCVGHDALFTRHSSAPVTTLITKDRVLAHNPTGALYSGYWRKKLEAEHDTL